MTKICAALGSSNRSKREREHLFFRVLRENKRRGERVSRLRKQRREKWLANLSLLARKGAESKYARVCSDHFVNGQFYILQIKYYILSLFVDVVIFDLLRYWL